jgi:hypothetical protein
MNFLKKLICAVIAAVFLAGCELTDTSDDIVVGGDYINPNKVTVTDSGRKDTYTDYAENADINDANDASENDESWELRDLLLYSVENSMYTDTSAPDGSALQMVVPSVTYSYKDMLKFLTDNAYMSQNYILAETSRDQSSYASFGMYGQHADASVEKLICGQKINNINNKEDEVLYSDILISVGQDYNTYSKPNYFSVVVNSTNITRDMQTMLYELLASQVGTEIAEYAIYAKALGSQDNELNLSDTIPTNDGRGNLVINRVVGGGNLNIELDFQDMNEFDESRYSYYDYEYKPVYNESRITLKDIFKGDFGGNDPTDNVNFFDKFMESGGRTDIPFSQTIKNNIDVKITEGTNKIYRNYQFRFDLSKGCSMNFEDSPFFNCDITAYFDSRSNNNYIKGNGEFIAGYTLAELCSDEEAFTELIESAKKKIICLFPCLNTADIRYENFYNNSYTLYGNYTATSSDIPVNVSAVVTLNTKYFQEYDEQGNATDTDVPQYYYVRVVFTLS